MQLEEQGKLDLDTDVNKYLDFQIRPAFDKPITLRNLMTHTGGFEETIDDMILTDPKMAVSLRDFLIRNQPQRIFPRARFRLIRITAWGWRVTSCRTSAGSRLSSTCRNTFLRHWG